MLARYLRWCERWRLAIILGGLVAFGISAFMASRLKLRTSFAELLPTDDPGVETLNRTSKRLGDLSLLLVGISSPDKAANIRYAEALTQRLRQLPPAICDLAAYHVRDMREFLDRNQWLYLKEADLEEIRDRMRREVAKRKNPLFIDLAEDGEEESVEALKARVTPKDELAGRFEGGYFAQGDYLWVAALPPGGMFVENAGDALLKAAQGFIAADPPSKYHPQMRAYIGGPIAGGIANRNALKSDIFWVSVTCVSLVVLSIGIYFRRARAVLLVGIPAVLGATMSYALAQILFGQLNLSSAFLGSIIVGNGINYGIVLLARYEEERAQGREAFEAITLAVGGVWRSTLVAALSATVAYGSLMVTSFRGFSQFGVIGGSGWIFCWIGTFIMVPALVLTLDLKPAPRRRVAPARIAWLANLISRNAGVFAVGSTVLTLVGLYGARHFLGSPFEYDFRKLSINTTKTEEAQKFERNQNDLFGRWPSPTHIVADSIGDVEKIEAAIRRQDAAAPGPDVIGQITTIFDILPGTPEEQRRKLALIASIRKLATDPALEVLDEKDRKDLLAATPPTDLRVLGPTDLPPLVRRPFTEADGTIGRVILTYPVEHGLSIWMGQDLLRIAAVMQNLTLDDGRVVPTSGHAVIFGSMIRSILRDGPIATLTAALTVLMIVLLTMRPWRLAGLALATLLVGVTWMVGAAGWAGVKITFLNFIALPITLGLGIEYAVNVLGRYQERGNVTEAVSATGGAVALCSWATIVGYASLLAAKNQALRGFGAMAILSEVACLLAAIIALPAFLVVWQRRTAARGGKAEQKVA